jgi:hypothetical protein
MNRGFMSRVRCGAVALLVLCGALAAQGPVVLMGIDAEDGNGTGSSHGGKAPYISVLNSILSSVTNGGSGVLVIGGGKAVGDDVTVFFNAIATGATPAQVATQVNGAANIASQSFAGFAVIAVASSQSETPSGGLTAAENTALSTRAADIANFVNGGGGLLGFSQTGLGSPYDYLGSIGAFTVNFPPQYSAVTPTPAGLAVGITATNLDVCCWHDQYLTFPGFLDVLATNDSTGLAAAIGGAGVVISQGIVLTPLNATNNVGTSHTVTATVATSLGMPIVGTTVTFTVISGPNVGQTGMAMTDAAGQATFAYIGSGGTGTDIIEACFIDVNMQQQCAQATKNWVECLLLFGMDSTSVALAPHPDLLLVSTLAYMTAVTMEDRPIIQIPNNPVFQGFTFYLQVGMWNPVDFPNDPLQMSNGVQVVIGQPWTPYGPNTDINLWIEEPAVILGGTMEANFSIAGL